MMAEVPIVGWDVAFTSKGIFLLEVNLSCNFFRGSFDMEHYVDFLNKQWLQLEKMEALNQDQCDSVSRNQVRKYPKRSSSTGQVKKE